MYKNFELEKALEYVENGASFKEAADKFNLNKSIVSREMRKRKNRNAVEAINSTRIKES